MALGIRTMRGACIQPTAKYQKVMTVLRVHLEASCGWVHGGHVLAITNVLHGKLGCCIPGQEIVFGTQIGTIIITLRHEIENYVSSQPCAWEVNFLESAKRNHSARNEGSRYYANANAKFDDEATGAVLLGRPLKRAALGRALTSARSRCAAE